MDEISAVAIDCPVVAADNATTVAMDANIQPDFVVTDLDGLVEDQIEANRRGATVFIHAHGDNIGALGRYAPMFKGNVVATCQCAPVDGTFNFGGFTDGDRAACICSSLGAKSLHLLGFDFENPAEKRGRDMDVKRRKLSWARRIISELESEGTRVLCGIATESPI